MEIRYKLYPYPVLAYYSDDYKDGSFDTTIDLQKDGYNIRIDFMASLTNVGLKKLIQDGQAQYVYHLECAQTGFREVVTTEKVSESRVLSDKKICGKLQICPFVVATQDIAGYSNPGFQYRWKIAKKCTKQDIKAHYFFGFGARRSLSRNALARLWWIGRLTYDDSRPDPYELTKFVCENADHALHIIERNTSNSPTIIRAFVSAILTARTEGLNINTDTVGELSKYLNLLGGTYILDCLPYDLLLGLSSCLGHTGWT